MTVLALGGSASVGKTTLADELAERLGVTTVVRVDDLRRQVITKEGPNFIDTTPDVWR